MLSHDFIHRIFRLVWAEYFDEFVLIDDKHFECGTIRVHLTSTGFTNFIKWDYEPKYNKFLKYLHEQI